jgi:sorting nexin-4
MADDFSNVSWQNDPRSNTSRTNTSRSLEERNGAGSSNSNGMRQGGGSSSSHPDDRGDPLDLAGVGGGILECTVSSPIKENEGTKDVFVSYLVTTHVRGFSFNFTKTLLMVIPDQFSIFCEANYNCPTKVHRLCLFV